jgi:hypothetical protein
VFHLILEKVSDQVVNVQSLLYEDDYPGAFVIQTRGEGSPECTSLRRGALSSFRSNARRA